MASEKKFKYQLVRNGKLEKVADLDWCFLIFSGVDIFQRL